MSGQQRGLTQFWQELRRRKVVRVITVYAAAAFVILELLSIIIEPLRLPDWTLRFAIVFLCIGFIIAVILSWIYDIKPEGGIVKTEPTHKVEPEEIPKSSNSWKIASYISFVVIVVLIVLNVFPQSNKKEILDKSIAVLPPINDSPDSSNLHIVNGIMGAINYNLQLIEDLTVIPRTSVERYRNTTMGIPEIANELSVSYILESTGQINGDKISFNVNLINAVEHKQIWSKRYLRNSTDIIKLEQEISEAVANEIRARITPEEEKRMSKAPTDNLIAYDYFKKGSDVLNRRAYFANWFTGLEEELKEAVKYFKNALEHDNQFALAYAELARIYSYLDFNQVENKYSNEINYYADKALFYDPDLDMSLIAKALFYLNKEEAESAVPYLEKALQYNPNSYIAIWYLDYIYWFRLTDTEKLLENALRAIKLNISTSNSTDKSDDYYRLSRAFRYAGFFNEAEMYINRSLEINPDNLLAVDEKGQLLCDNGEGYQQAKELLIEAYNKDSSVVDIIRSLGLINYFMRDYAGAYKYYERLIEISGSYNLGSYRGDYGRIGFVFSKMGLEKESEEFFNKQMNIIENLDAFGKNRNLVAVYSYRGDITKALELMKELSQQVNYPYWVIRCFNDGPMYDNIRNLSEFQKILSEMETKFWENHERIKTKLKDKGLL